MIDFSLESLSYIPYRALFLGPQQNLETPCESSPPSSQQKSVSSRWDHCFFPFFPYFSRVHLFFYQKSSPHHINSTSLIFTCLLHLYLLLPSYLELSAYWGGRLKRRERQWWIMLLGFCFEELFLMLDCLVCYWFLLSMVVKTAVLKYCNHPSKRPGVRLAAGSVCIFVLNLSYFLWNSFRSNFTCIFGGYFFVL